MIKCLNINFVERLRRLDESIRLTLAEKQKIVCDIFRVPNEHFSAIADIAGQPEAPKVKCLIIRFFFLKNKCNSMRWIN